MSKLDELRRNMGANVTESASKRDSKVVPTLPSLSSARNEGATRSKNAHEIQVERIHPDPNQPREEFDPEALERLAASLKNRGQLQPIRVRWDEEQERYVIISGERRWRAAKMAGLATLTCVVADAPLDAGDLLAVQLIENCVREDLAPIEQAKAFRIVMDKMGWSGNRLAQELGIAQTGVVHALALLELPAEVQVQVEQGELPASTAYEIGKAGDADTIRQVAARVVQGGLSRAEAVEHVRRVAKTPKKGRGAAKVGPPKPRTFRLASGKATFEPKKVGGLEALIAMTREILETLESELESQSQEAA